MHDFSFTASGTKNKEMKYYCAQKKKKNTKRLHVHYLDYMVCKLLFHNLKFALDAGVINCVCLFKLKPLMILIAMFSMHNLLFQKKKSKQNLPEFLPRETDSAVLLQKATTQKL